MERSSIGEEDLSEELLVNEVVEAVLEDGPSTQRIPSRRQPFTSLSQVDADLALARALQQQEHAYLLLQMGADGSEYDTTGSGSFDYDYTHDEEGEHDEVFELPLVLPPQEDEVGDEAGNGETDGSLYENDEAFARALQEAEHHDARVYVMDLVGIEESDREEEEQSDDSQDAWEDIDPDNMSYEELVALGEAVGTHSRGLTPDVIAALPYSKYVQDENSCMNSEDPCVICRFEYEEGDCLSTLPCKHHYHTECIKNWLQINKACPICSAEVAS